MFLDAIRARPGGLDGEGFPFDLAVLRGFEELRLTTPVTFLVGENGSGKSTVLEAIAAGVGCRLGSARLARLRRRASSRRGGPTDAAGGRETTGVPTDRHHGRAPGPIDGSYQDREPRPTEGARAPARRP